MFRPGEGLRQTFNPTIPTFNPNVHNRETYNRLIRTSLTYRAPAKYQLGKWIDFYTGLGIRCLPVCGIRPDGTATCSYGVYCNDVGKHSLTSWNGATTDATLLHDWFAQPGHQWDNLGFITGNGLLVLDVDPDAWTSRDELINDFQVQFDDIPETLRVRTGRGFHIYLRYDPFYALPSFDFTMRDGTIQMFGDPRSLCNAVGSVHPSGHVYGWEPGYRPGEVPGIAEAPDWLINLIRGRKRIKLPPSAAPNRSKPKRNRSPNKLSINLYPDLLLKGSRNMTVFKWAVMFRDHGFTLEQARYFIEHTHNDVAQPKLSESELNRQIESAYRYPRRPTRNPNKLGANAVRILELIKERSTGQPVTFSITEIMDQAGISKPTVIRALNRLEQLGYMRAERRPGAKTTYMTLEEHEKPEPI